MNKRTRILVTASILTVGLTCGGFALSGKTSQQRNITIFAAASMSNVISEISGKYSAGKDLGVSISAASSGILARQIANGAKSDVYISASRKWMEYLIEKKLADPARTFAFASNRLIVIAPADSPFEREEFSTCYDFRKLLGDGMLAIGDPHHVPAGKYAKKSLVSLGCWEGLDGRMSLESNVVAVLHKVASGNARVGIVYASNIVGVDNVKVLGELPRESYPEIEYYISIINSDNPDAGELLNYIIGSEATGSFRKFGFIPLEGP